MNQLMLSRRWDEVMLNPQPLPPGPDDYKPVMKMNQLNARLGKMVAVR